VDGDAAPSHRIDAMPADAYVGFETVLLPINACPGKVQSAFRKRHATASESTARAEAFMSFRVSGKNLDVGEALRARINSRIGEAMSKYFDGGYSGHVTVAREDSGFRTECAVHLDSKITLRAEASAPDAYASADEAALRMEKQLRRYHRRLKDHRC
jgi:ribosomal subunit interface protein